jgi:hypothetical protein
MLAPLELHPSATLSVHFAEPGEKLPFQILIVGQIVSSAVSCFGDERPLEVEWSTSQRAFRFARYLQRARERLVDAHEQQGRVLDFHRQS